MKLLHDEAKKRFDLYDVDDSHIGEIEYMKGGGNQLFATHTEVFPGYEGKGYARQLLDALVAYAVEQKATIVPICPYVIAAFKKHPERYAAVIGTGQGGPPPAQP